MCSYPRGCDVHNDPFQKHEQRIGGVLLFWYANPTLIVQETAQTRLKNVLCPNP
jgi:hypothetical protein